MIVLELACRTVADVRAVVVAVGIPIDLAIDQLAELGVGGVHEHVGSPVGLAQRQDANLLVEGAQGARLRQVRQLVRSRVLACL